MKWKKFTLTTKTEAIDLLSAEFDEIGIEGIEIEDNIPLSERDTRGMFIDILPELPADEGIAKISFYLDPDSDIEGMLFRVQEVLEDVQNFVDIGEGTIIESETADKDWINNWKAFFKPFTIGNILIKPTWEDIPDVDYQTLIQIDPGTAFGTGSHETTKLCILALQKYIDIEKKTNPQIEVLDVGTGSGILSIVALKLGASHVFATDLDEMAMDAVVMNMESNGIASVQLCVVCGDIIEDESIIVQAGDAKYDIAVANILAPVIIDLQKIIHRHLKVGGIFITSGIIDTKEEEVLEAFHVNPAFEVLEVNHLGEWISIVARRV